MVTLYLYCKKNYFEYNPFFSLIPTEDDLEEVQETYEEINVHQAPPVPETPRPYLRPEGISIYTLR